MTSADLLRPPVLKALCARAGVRPDRKAGQNFLINHGTLERIVAAVDPRPGDTILEVGAGFGVLTLALAERLKNGELKNGEQRGRIIAIERDHHITPILHELVMPYGNVEVVEGDVLRMLRAAGQGGSRAAGLTQLPESAAALRLCCSAANWKLAANLPYSITSDFLRLLFDRIADGSLPPPERAVLLLQREVVDRLCADPSRASDRRAVGILTMLTQLHCAPRRIMRVPPSHFWPQPKVESAVVVLEGWRTPEEIESLLTQAGKHRVLIGKTPDVEEPASGTRSAGSPDAAVGADSTPEVSRRFAPPQPPVFPARAQFLRLVRTAFGKRRGQLQRTLRSVTRDPSTALRMARIDPTARPEELTVEQWIALARAMHEAT